MMGIKSASTKDNIILIGFMGSGKSSIGEFLSRKISYDFIDSDKKISEITKLSISEIFHLYGEQYFRILEKDFITQYKNIKKHIIATGGGMPIFNDVRGMGKIFFLKADFEVLYHRICNTNTRPLLQNKQKTYEIFMQRQEKYHQSSDYIINANQSIEKITEDILKILNPSSDT
ncbi:shikimate kinase [Helicobacter anseris]|uniref:Shikimate kinase n=1 Tax=Helicobacter anseris TaxID=375926 RepID=A0A3D8J7X7_9HELI|nr:shikimate kinase [Helicobacter anseris]RDU73285.1 shikimate kinase [Helicobacter anseris]